MIRDSNGNIAEKAEVIVIPLSTKVENPRLIVWIGRNMETSTFYSTDRPSVVAQCGNFPILVFGKMDGHEFHSQIKLPKKYQQYQLEINTRDNGTEGHLYLVKDQYRVHISPVSFRNNENDYADFVYCIAEHGAVTDCGDNSEKDITLTLNQIPYHLLCKWNEGILYATLSDASDPVSQK